MIQRFAPDKCPACGSAKHWKCVGSQRQGISIGKAIGGWLIAGPITAAIGASMGNEVYPYYCTKCGYAQSYKFASSHSEYLSDEDIQEIEQSKVLETKASITAAPVVVTKDNYETILTRIDIFLEDGEWPNADSYAEQILNYDPKSGEAYFRKLLSSQMAHSVDELCSSLSSIASDKNYEKILRFGSQELKDRVQGIEKQIQQNIIDAEKEEKYQKILDEIRNAKDEDDYYKVINEIKKLDDPRAESLIDNCNRKISRLKEKIETDRKNAIYKEATRLASGSSPKIYEIESAIDKFKSIIDWKDSEKQIDICNEKIEQLKKDAEEKSKKIKRTAKKIIFFLIVLAGVSFSLKYIVANKKYNDAIELKNNGSYSEAIIAFRYLDGFKDSEKQIEECINSILENSYQAALELKRNGAFEEAIERFTNLNGYSDSEKQIAECEVGIVDRSYNTALNLISKKEFIEAHDILQTISDYKDSKTILKNIDADYKVSIIKQSKVKDTVLFGAYEQDNNHSNGKEDIEWVILEKKDNKVLLLSRKILDAKEFNDTASFATWDKSSLRTWMNSTFPNLAFSKNELEKIVESEVKATRNTDEHEVYNTDPGKDTIDKLFCLSVEEVDRYLDIYQYKIYSGMTDYAFKNSKLEDASDYKANKWWTRTPGWKYCIVTADSHGHDSRGSEASRAKVDYMARDFSIEPHIFGVRPAMWVSLD